MIVPASGSKQARIALVGEAPGEEEEKQGIPFVGSSGQLLNNCLIQAGVSRQDCYITNVVKVRPPDNKILRLVELGVSVDKCVEELKEELSGCSANIIVAVGATALKALTGLSAVTKWRGSILPSTLLPDRKVLVTIHPAYILRGAIEQTAFLISDLKKAKKESLFSDIRRPKRRFILNPTFDEVIYQLERMKTSQYLSVDIENIPGINVITELGLGDSSDFAITIPFVRGNKSVWSPEQEEAIWERIKYLLTCPYIYKIAQNATHELTLLYPWVGEIYPMSMDTMILQHLAYCELPKDLETISSLYTDEPFYKDFKNEPDYNAKDVVVTFESAFNLLNNEIAPAGLTDFLFGYQMLFLIIMWKASMKGILVDTIKLKEHREKVEVIYEKNLTLLEQLVGHPLNIESPKQVHKFLYIELNLPVQRNKGKITSDEKALHRLYKKTKLPVLNLIIDLREQAKALSTYLSLSFLDADNRCRSSWVVTGTETGRLSSRKNTNGTGCNMQNIPKATRDIFIADEGCSFVVGDLSQVEARFVAWLSEDPTYKKFFRTGEDIHKKVASWIFRTDYNLIMDEQRQKAKATAHGAPYGIGYKRIAEMYNIPEDEAEWLLGQYFVAFPNVKSIYQDGIVQQLSKNRLLVSPFGRRRIFFNYWGEELFRQAYAHLPQGLGADTINRAACRLFFRLPEGANILLQIHDELVVQCKDTDVNKVVSMLREEVERPLSIKGDTVTIPIAIKVGKRWHSDYLKEVALGS